MLAELIRSMKVVTQPFEETEDDDQGVVSGLRSSGLRSVPGWNESCAGQKYIVPSQWGGRTFGQESSHALRTTSIQIGLSLVITSRV